MKRTRICLLRKGIPLVILLALTVVPALAYTPLTGQSVGLGGDAGVTPRGAEAVGWNPAFLAFQDNPAYSFYVPMVNFGTRFSNNSFSFSLINKYFQDGKVLDDAAKDDILDHVKGGALRIRSDASLPAFGMSFPTEYLSMAVNFNVYSASDFSLDKEFIRLGLYGYGTDEFGRERNFDELEMESSSVGRLSLTGAKRFHELQFVNDNDWLDELTAGVTFSYSFGMGYAHVQESDASVYADYDSLSSSGFLDLVTATSGYGVGLDLGMGAKIFGKRGTIGLSLINLINTIHWTNAERRIYSYNTEFHPYYDPTEILSAPSLEGMNDIESWFDDSFSPLDSTIKGGEVSSSLPMSLVISGGWWFRDNLLVTGALREGLNDVAGNSFTPRLTVGGEYYPLQWLPVRTGFGFGGRTGFNWGLGAGVRKGIWRMDLGFAYDNGLFYGMKGLTFAWSTSFFFGETASDIATDPLPPSERVMP